MGLGATWNPDLLYAAGQLLSRECEAKIPNAPAAKLIEASELKNAGSIGSHVHALEGVNG